MGHTKLDTLQFTLSILAICLTSTIQISSAQPSNDLCENATLITLIDASPWIIQAGTTTEATIKPISSICISEDKPGVWYRVQNTLDRVSFSIQVTSDDLSEPSIVLFDDDCDSLVAVNCQVGTRGKVLLTDHEIPKHGSLLFMVFDANGGTGNFVFKYNHATTFEECNVDQSIQVVATSAGSPPEGPFLSGETVTICYSTRFTSSGNNCQWFQGIVPVFNEGWDPELSFVNGPGTSPINATLNGNSLPTSGQSSGGTFWDWSFETEYHQEHETYAIGDFDQNGSLDMCDFRYDPDCPVVGLEGGEGGPCWNNGLSGDQLPGGWFAWGLDGSCPGQTGSASVDYGDGNCCGCIMGPWEFCFDLVVGNDTCGGSRRWPLSVEIFSFSDGETGSWSGGQSICSQDKPVRLSRHGVCCDSLRETGFASGKLFQSLNGSCELDSSAPVIANVVIQARSTATQEVFQSTTRSTGYFHFVLDTGAYWIRPVTNFINTAVCSDSVLVEVKEGCSRALVNLGFNAEELCPQVELTLVPAWMNVCDEGGILLEAINNGNVSLENPEYLVELDTMLELISADVPFTHLGNYQYLLEGNPLNVGAKEFIQLAVSVRCVGTLQSHTCSSVQLTNGFCGTENPEDLGCALLGSREECANPPSLDSIQIIHDDGTGVGSIEIFPMGGTPPYQYDWINYLPDSTFLGGLSPGHYTFLIVDAIGCETESTFVVELSTSTSDLKKPQAIMLKPNPASTHLMYQTFGRKLESLHIYHSDGREHLNLMRPPRQGTIDVAALPKGLYIIVCMDSSGERIVERFVKS